MSTLSFNLSDSRRRRRAARPEAAAAQSAAARCDACRDDKAALAEQWRLCMEEQRRLQKAAGRLEQDVARWSEWRDRHKEAWHGRGASGSSGSSGSSGGAAGQHEKENKTEIEHHHYSDGAFHVGPVVRANEQVEKVRALTGRGLQQLLQGREELAAVREKLEANRSALEKERQDVALYATERQRQAEKNWEAIRRERKMLEDERALFDRQVAELEEEQRAVQHEKLLVDHQRKLISDEIERVDRIKSGLDFEREQQECNRRHQPSLAQLEMDEAAAERIAQKERELNDQLLEVVQARSELEAGQMELAAAWSALCAEKGSEDQDELEEQKLQSPNSRACSQTSSIDAVEAKVAMLLEENDRLRNELASTQTQLCEGLFWEDEPSVLSIGWNKERERIQAEKEETMSRLASDREGLQAELAHIQEQADLYREKWENCLNDRETCEGKLRKRVSELSMEVADLRALLHAAEDGEDLRLKTALTEEICQSQEAIAALQSKSALREGMLQAHIESLSAALKVAQGKAEDEPQEFRQTLSGGEALVSGNAAPPSARLSCGAKPQPTTNQLPDHDSGDKPGTPLVETCEEDTSYSEDDYSDLPALKTPPQVSRKSSGSTDSQFISTPAEPAQGSYPVVERAGIVLVDDESSSEGGLSYEPRFLVLHRDLGIGLFLDEAEYNKNPEVRARYIKPIRFEVEASCVGKGLRAQDNPEEQQSSVDLVVGLATELDAPLGRFKRAFSGTKAPCTPIRIKLSDRAELDSWQNSLKGFCNEQTKAEAHPRLVATFTPISMVNTNTAA